MLPIIHDYLMPHELDRVGQQEAFEAVMNWYKGPKQYMILSAPTGIGKTGILAEMTKHARVMALARTKVLLSSVYKGDYSFDELQGKQNHPCRVAPLTHKADVCAIPDETPPDEKYELCQGSGECSYYNQYEEFCASFKAVTTYAKFISDRKPYNSPTLFAFDEAHEVPEAVIEQSGINLDTTKRKYLKNFGDLDDHSDLGFDAGIKIMRKLYSVALKNAPKQSKSWHEMSDREMITFKREVMRHRQFLKRLEESAKLMIASENEGLNIWHYSSTKSGEFSARPMTAAYHFKHIMNTGSQKTLLMSATIDPIMAEFLGLADDEFEFYEAPQQYPVTMRPIYDLGQPSMGNAALRKNPALWNMQAIRISNVLKLRPDVSSVVLVTSKKKARILARLLEGYGHDVFTPPIGLGTDLQLRAWRQYRRPGAVCVSYNFWEGVSLDLDHMLFIAGIKYPDLGSDFEMARANRSWEEFYYRGGVNMVQGAGRIQRGHLSDYLPVGNKQVFIAVGNYNRAAKLAPGDFAERIVPWKGCIA